MNSMSIHNATEIKLKRKQIGVGGSPYGTFEVLVRNDTGEWTEITMFTHNKDVLENLEVIDNEWIRIWGRYGIRVRRSKQLGGGLNGRSKEVLLWFRWIW